MRWRALPERQGNGSAAARVHFQPLRSPALTEPDATYAVPTSGGDRSYVNSAIRSDPAEDLRRLATGERFPEKARPEVFTTS